MGGHNFIIFCWFEFFPTDLHTTGLALHEENMGNRTSTGKSGHMRTTTFRDGYYSNNGPINIQKQLVDYIQFNTGQKTGAPSEMPMLFRSLKPALGSMSTRGLHII